MLARLAMFRHYFSEGIMTSLLSIENLFERILSKNEAISSKITNRKRNSLEKRGKNWLRKLPTVFYVQIGHRRWHIGNFVSVV